MEPIEKQAYNSEQDDYWLVIEMHQAWVEWLRFQRFGKITEKDEDKESHIEEEKLDEVLNLDQRRSARNMSKYSKVSRSPTSKMFGATKSALSSSTTQTN